MLPRCLAALLLSSATLAARGVAPSPGPPPFFLSVNCSGLRFESALQAAVAQGLLNRRHGPHVYLTGIATGLGRAGQRDGAGFPGAKFIEWMAGRAGGPWYEPQSSCRTCEGLEGRWLQTAAEAATAQPRPTTFAQLMAAVAPLLVGRVVYSRSEMHALGPALTMAGVQSVLPVTADCDPLPTLPVSLDTRGMWKDATAATVYTTRSLLSRTNRTVLAVQAPTCLPFLADAIVDYQMAVFWMDDMCSMATEDTRAQHAAMEALLETSGHFVRRGLYYMGWFNHTREPNPELLEECTRKHSVLTLASDQSPNLSFLSKLPTIATPLLQPPMFGGAQPRVFDQRKSYVALMMSDGDNIAEDWTELRPLLEERVQSRSQVPVSWTISNRWITWGAPVLRWAFAQAMKTGVDSFLMGPSGYGYSFPGNMSSAADKDWTAAATVEAAQMLGMEAYVHWDVDRFLDNATTSRTIDYIRRFNSSAIKGAFMLGSDPMDGKWPVPTADRTETVFVGDVATFSPIYQYGPANSTLAAAAINAVPAGALVYCYLGLGDDMRLVDQIAQLVSPRVELVGYRELIALARQRRMRD